MRTEEEIKVRIVELESRDIPEEDAYLDEGEQAELMTLNWVLNDENY